ncbi:MAG: ABC transporter ATP-binding protein [Halobacteriales archaeon]|nr:ABC transporter ATP-binding protein [Halobacteriales archaeon]
MPLLRLENVSKHFGDLIAVDNASFDVDDGEFVSILGPSGSGKSTILRMIAGFETPTEGEIYISNENIVGVPPFERDVHMVFQSLALFPHLTVEENIAYGLKNRGVRESEREERINRMLEIVRLEGYNDRDPNQLSGGEQQRVALARALVNQPEMVLFDEPLASLDRKLRQHMQVELQRIQSETGITFLYVTHDQEVAMSVSDRLVLLHNGQIEQIGTAEELYENPVSQFVADFIGDVNTLPGTIRSVSDSTTTIEVGDNELMVESDAIITDGREPRPDDTVAVCVRAEHIQIDEQPSDGFEIRGHIRNRIYKGDEVSYIIETDSATLQVDTDSARFQIGEPVYAKWDETETHVFPSSGDEAVELEQTGVV